MSLKANTATTDTITIAIIDVIITIIFLGFIIGVLTFFGLALQNGYLCNKTKDIETNKQILSVDSLKGEVPHIMDLKKVNIAPVLTKDSISH